MQSISAILWQRKILKKVLKLTLTKKLVNKSRLVTKKQKKTNSKIYIYIKKRHLGEQRLKFVKIKRILEKCKPLFPNYQRSN